jgi:hypothetical protein
VARWEPASTRSAARSTSPQAPCCESACRGWDQAPVVGSRWPVTEATTVGTSTRSYARRSWRTHGQGCLRQRSRLQPQWLPGHPGYGRTRDPTSRPRSHSRPWLSASRPSVGRVVATAASCSPSPNRRLGTPPWATPRRTGRSVALSSIRTSSRRRSGPRARAPGPRRAWPARGVETAASNGVGLVQPPGSRAPGGRSPCAGRTACSKGSRRTTDQSALHSPRRARSRDRGRFPRAHARSSRCCPAGFVPGGVWWGTSAMAVTRPRVSAAGAMRMADATNTRTTTMAERSP